MAARGGRVGRRLGIACLLGLPEERARHEGYVYVSNGKSDTVTVIDTTSFAPLRTLNVGKHPTGSYGEPGQ